MFNAADAPYETIEVDPICTFTSSRYCENHPLQVKFGPTSSLWQPTTGTFETKQITWAHSQGLRLLYPIVGILSNAAGAQRETVEFDPSFAAFCAQKGVDQTKPITSGESQGPLLLYSIVGIFSNAAHAQYGTIEIDPFYPYKVALSC